MFQVGDTIKVMLDSYHTMYTVNVISTYNMSQTFIE